MKTFLKKRTVLISTIVMAVVALALGFGYRTIVKATDFTELVDFVVEVESGRDVRVLQLSDTQISVLSVAEEECYQYVRQIIEKTQPDLIVIPGDLVAGTTDEVDTIFLDFIKFMDSFQTPWAPVFGNHDNEGPKGVDWQCKQLENSEYCLFKQREMTGNGNYTVGIVQNNKLTRTFVMLDSNGCTNMSQASFANGHSKKAEGFGQDQINWYTQQVSKIKAECPDVNLTFVFHIQLAVFADAYEKYGYPNNLPINLDVVGEPGDFGYLGARLKYDWDASKQVWNGLKNLGVDSLLVGHVHENSASVMYEGIRLQYGQKSSTFDRSNFMTPSGIVTSYTNVGTPIVGGTLMALEENTGRLGDVQIVLYEEPQQDTSRPRSETTYDFNNTDFDANVTIGHLLGFAAEKMNNTSNVPTDFSDSVYSLQNGAHIACVGVDFPQNIKFSDLISLKVRMYVQEHGISSGKTPLVRIYNDTDANVLKEVTFESLEGKFDEWIELDILPLLKEANLNTNDILQPFTFVYRYYSTETEGTPVYFDSIITEMYVDNPCTHSTTNSVANVSVRDCTQKGYTGDVVCDDCKAVLIKGIELNALGHYYTEATCANKATCTRCETTVGDFEEHSLLHVPANKGDCKHPGNVEYYACSSCQKWFLDETGSQEIIDRNSVFISSSEHLDSDADGRCDLCEEPIESFEQGSGGVKTGDIIKTSIWFLLVAMSVCGIYGVVRYRKNRK